MSSPTSWTAPYWSHPPPPTATWTLLEIKQGILLKTYPLTALSALRRGCITLGRIDDPALIDIVTAHESCSRLHARLAFDSHGVPWLRDLGSNHGTFVNGVRLPAEACGKMEVERGSREDGARGSRGVMVYPGDVFQFGASTRIFCLEGPEEYDRGKHGERVNEKKLEGNSLVAEEEGNVNVQEMEQQQKQIVAECHWGMGEDATEDDDENDHHLRARSMDPNLPSIEAFFSSSSSKYTIPASLQQLYKTLQTKQGKLHSLQLESQRIMQKEDRGIELTEGQTKQLEKNRERMENLEKDLDDLHAKIEEGIYGVVHGVNGSLGAKRKVQSRKAKEEDDVDDFYDRTAAVNKKRRSGLEEGEAESEKSLIQKWKLFYSSHHEQLDRVSKALHKCQEIQSQINAMDDEEEAFFLQNDLTLANEELNKARSLLSSTEKEWSDAEFLLKIVNPKLSWNRSDGWIGLESEREERLIDPHKENVGGNNGALQNDVAVMIPPPPKLHGGDASFSDQTESLGGRDTFAQSTSMPPSDLLPSHTIKAPCVVEPAMPLPIDSQDNPHTLSISQSDSRATTVTKTKRQVGPSRPVVGTLAALQQAIRPQTNKEKSTPSDSQSEEKKLSAPIFDPRKDEWKAPTDQDGSGRTSLHDKFKGRY